MKYVYIVVILIQLKFLQAWIVQNLKQAHYIRKSSTILKIEEDDGIGDVEDQDWRKFRAKLVMESTGISLDGPDGWAYEQGNVIETGSIVISQPEQDFSFGLNQQYFHKCVMLVVSHDENSHTIGVILNRPTDLILSDDDFIMDDGTPLINSNSSNFWQVYYGGEVRGIATDEPDIFCIHNLTSDEADEVSETIIQDIKYTSFEEARSLVHSNHANPSDFWLFVGYAGWIPGQLRNEIERESWHMVSCDADTILKLLTEQSTDTRAAGLDIWSSIMNKIGKKQSVHESEESFEDLMLLEWAKENLLYEEKNENIIFESDITPSRLFLPGTFLRSKDDLHNPPFLLEKQFLHKATVVVISQTSEHIVAAVLNLPSQDTLLEQNTVPIRFGGKFQQDGEEDNTIWLHLNQTLKDANIGSPLHSIESDQSSSSVWSCSKEEALNAIDSGKANPSDFIVVDALCFFPHHQEAINRLIDADSSSTLFFDDYTLPSKFPLANFEIIPSKQVESVWNLLLQQKALSPNTIDKNIQIAETAWNLGKKNTTELSFENNTTLSIQSSDLVQEDLYVYKTNVKISALADDALRTWIATVLLQDQSFSRRYSALE